jgi:hypothetical protein
MKTVDIHVFSPGVQTSAQGVTREFTKKDLKQVADSYDSGVHEAPIRIGHEDNDKVPSWGWVKGVKMKGDDLYAEVEFSPLMEDYVKNGLYRKVSASFYSPESKINPEPGKWSLRHVAMLGAQPPAVKGLKGFAYSEESFADGVLDFASATELKPESVFDKELGPTLKSDMNPFEYLKEKLEEARTEMAKVEKDKAELEAQAPNQQPEANQQGPEFAEKMKKAPKGKMGAEDAEEEVSEDESMDMADCGSKKKRNYKEKDSMDHADCPGCADEKADHKEGCSKYTQMKGGKKAEMMDMDEAKHAEAEALRQGKASKVGASRHDNKMIPSPDEETDGPGPVVGKQSKKYQQGDAMQDPLKDEYLPEQKQQYTEDEAQHNEDPERAYKDVPQGEAMQDPKKGKYRKEQNQQYVETEDDKAKMKKRGLAFEEDDAKHTEGPAKRMDKVKKDVTEGENESDPKKGQYRPEQNMQYSEVEVPAGYDVEEYRDGFMQAALAYAEAILIDGDVEFSEDDDVTESFKAGVEAGLEFAESEVIRNGKPTGVGSTKHDNKMVASPDEETDIPGKDTHPDTPRKPDSGKNECDDCGEYEESTKMTKRGKDGLVSSSFTGDSEEHKEVFQDLPDGSAEGKDGRADNHAAKKPGKPDTKDYKSKTKVKATKTLKHGDDGLDKRPSSKDLGRQNDQSGRGETGEAGEEGKTFRARGGKSPQSEAQGTDFARSQKGDDGGAQDADRRNTGKSIELEKGRMITGKPEPQNVDDHAKASSLGGVPGSGAAVKKPQVRVMYVGKKGGTTPLTANFAETEQFSELSARLAELEAANARLVQEKQAAVRAAHRSQLVEFTESLYNTGRLTPAVCDADELVDYMEGLEYGTLEFAEGESAATKLMELLANLPAQVSFSEIAAFNKDELPTESLDPHERALRLVKEEGLEYSEALKKSLFTVE